MTPEQRKLFLALVVINLLACCIGLPLVIVWMNAGGTQTQGESLLSSLLPTPRPTLTPRPTASPTRPVPTPTLEPGWKLHTVAAEGFAIALPATYEELATSDETAWKTAVAAYEKKKPKLFAFLKQVPVSSLMRFYGVDTTPTALVDNVAPSASVVRLPDSPPASLDQYISQSGEGIKKVCGSQPTALTQGRTKLAVGDAGFFRCRIVIPLSKGAVFDQTLTEYYWIRGTDLYFINVAHARKLDSKYLPLEEKIANTFRWINK